MTLFIPEQGVIRTPLSHCELSIISSLTARWELIDHRSSQLGKYFDTDKVRSWTFVVNNQYEVQRAISISEASHHYNGKFKKPHQRVCKNIRFGTRALICVWRSHGVFPTLDLGTVSKEQTTSSFPFLSST